MPRYLAHEDSPHFCTITVLDWVPVFIDERYVRPLIESLRFCREKKGLRLYAYVVMPNHLHLIARAEGGLHPLRRDFKRFTSRSVQDLLVAAERTTLLSWLRSAMEPGRRERGEFSLWKSGFHPQALYSEKVLLQKLEYLYNNPVRKGLVGRPEYWRFGSAGENRILEVDPLEDLI
jgi:REP element-mobilizing transposase RayT